MDGGQANPKDLAAAATDCAQNTGWSLLRNPECSGPVPTAETTMPRTYARPRWLHNAETGREKNDDYKCIERRFDARCFIAPKS